MTCENFVVIEPGRTHMSISKLTENNPYTYPYHLRYDADTSSFYLQPPDRDRRTLPDVYWTKGQLNSKFVLPLSPPYGIKPSRLSKDYHITFRIWNWSWDPMGFLRECLWTPCLRAELYLQQSLSESRCSLDLQSESLRLNQPKSWQQHLIG